VVAPPGGTLESVLGPGVVVKAGARQAYRRLAGAPGSPRLLRDDLGTAGRRRPSSRSLVYLAHVTDLQLADVQSPGRFEFMEAYRGVPGSSALIPAQRPQEALCAHAISEMVRAIGRHLESRDTGAPLQLAVSTGDSLDNAQWNELEWYLALMAGGTVGGTVGATGTATYEGVQRTDWPGDLYWKPDEVAGRFQRELGFPTVAGLLDRAIARFETTGFPVGWVSCFGNHDGLPFGEVVPTPEYRSLVIDGRKSVGLPPGLEVLDRQDALYASPERFLSGPARQVRPDERRRIVGRSEFVAGHLAAPGLPLGHGFSRLHLDQGTAYTVVDLGPFVRLILLDTTNLDGDAKGSLGARQMQWLEEQLVAVHSRYRAADGREARTSNGDSLVILASHHGLASLTNLRRSDAGEEPDQPRVGREAVEAFLHRFPNVVLWLNGHRHVNDIAVRPSASRDGSAFADVATCSIADWPSQSRLVELVANEDGTLSVLTQMLDHGAPPVPEDASSSVANLASLHRELAANVPGGGFATALEGSPADRNVELLLRSPFPVFPRL
jgi:metallophosphoesterase (TIGR03767 family)